MAGHFKFVAMRYERAMTPAERLRVAFFRRTLPLIERVLPASFDEGSQESEYPPLRRWWIRGSMRPVVSGAGFGEAHIHDSGGVLTMSGWNEEFLKTFSTFQGGRIEFWEKRSVGPPPAYYSKMIPAATPTYINYDFHTSTKLVDGFKIGLKFDE